jgi:preprotein translocase subunit SecA
VASRLPETFETVRVKMGGKIAFVLEQQDLALEKICSSDEFSAKDKLKATQDYLMLWIRLQNEVQKEQEFKENIKNKNELIHDLKEKAVKLYEDKEALFPEAEQIREIERVILLKVIDRKWMDHIDDMDQLKQGIGLQALGQRDPVVQYKMMGYDMFDEMTAGITEDTVRLLMHIQVEQKVEREQVAKVTGTNKDEGPSVKGPARRTEKKIYPNDPCPCGSGKKYKNCCGRQA